MKLGRNEHCLCGSGKKYKRCCISKKQASPSLKMSLPPGMMEHAREMMRLHEARENVRQQQQGYGNAIVSWIDRGYRFVAVGKKIHWAKEWLVFPDFLLAFLKNTLGSEWGESNRDKGKHPIFRWLAKFQHHNDNAQAEGRLKIGTMVGFLACWLHLAYALYLIAHHDEIPLSLLKRLRNPVTFLPAYYETLIGAALAVAGFELRSAETKTTSDPTPEFRAKSKTSGKTYEVEAKRKEAWKSPTHDLSNADFQAELRSYVRDQLHASSKKKLKNPVYWFELNIPTLIKEKDWRDIAGKVEETIREAEKTMTVAGEPIAPAFVTVTNHTFLANEDIEGQPAFGFLTTIKIDDYPFGRAMEIENALESYDKYRDIFWMMEAWKVAQTVPTTFDGTPPELLSPDGIPKPTIRIGDTVNVPDYEGKIVHARITEIASMEDKAMVALTANGRSWLTQVPLSDGEMKAAARFTDAVFGKANASRGLKEDDPFGLYDFFLRAHADMTQENVNTFFNENPALREFKDLPLKEARVRIAREHTKWLWIRAQQAKHNDGCV